MFTDRLRALSDSSDKKVHEHREMNFDVVRFLCDSPIFTFNFGLVPDWSTFFNLSHSLSKVDFAADFFTAPKLSIVTSVCLKL